MGTCGGVGASIGGFGGGLGDAQVAGITAGMAGLSAGGANRTSSLAPGIVSGDRASLRLNYQQPGKKATTILSPHLETIEYGGMSIVLDA